MWERGYIHTCVCLLKSRQYSLKFIVVLQCIARTLRFADSPQSRRMSESRRTDLISQLLKSLSMVIVKSHLHSENLITTPQLPHPQTPGTTSYI